MRRRFQGGAAHGVTAAGSAQAVLRARQIPFTHMPVNSVKLSVQSASVAQASAIRLNGQLPSILHAELPQLGDWQRWYAVQVAVALLQ